jgi:hypothetical protein
MLQISKVLQDEEGTRAGEARPTPIARIIHD